MGKEETLYTKEGNAVKAWKRKKKKSFAEKHWVEFSKIVVTLVIATYFLMVIVGVVDGAVRGEDFQHLLSFVLEHTRPVLYGYFAKAFGENIFKILMSKKQNEEGGE